MDIILRTDFEDKINLFLGRLVDISSPDINKVVDYSVLFLLVIQIVFFQKYTMKELYTLLLASLPVVIATITSGNNHLISVLLFAAAAKNADFDKVIRLAYILLLITITFVIVMCFLGVLTDYTMYRHSLLRHSLGFEHPNRLGLRCFQLAACHCYLYRNKRKRLLTAVLLLALAYFAYKVPNSQTAYICLTILSGIFILAKVIEKNRRRERLVLRFFGLMTVFLSIGTVVLSFFNPKSLKLYDNIDRIMSRRFWWCYRMYKYYGVSWFGQKVSTIVPDKLYRGIFRQWYLDNAFFSILLCYGIVVYVVFTAIYLVTIYRYIQKSEFMMVAILFLYALYGIMTTGFYMMSHNIFLLAISTFFYGQSYFSERKIVQKDENLKLAINPR
jgi:hypothetical protein